MSRWMKGVARTGHGSVGNPLRWGGLRMLCLLALLGLALTTAQAAGNSITSSDTAGNVGGFTSSADLDSIVGTIAYPSINCGGEYTLQSVSSDSITLFEDLTYGTSTCVDEGIVTLSLTSPDEMAFAWEKEGSGAIGVGTLARISSAGEVIPSAYSGVWRGEGSQTNPTMNWSILIGLSGNTGPVDPDLKVTITDTPNPVAQGDEITYDIVVSNSAAAGDSSEVQLLITLDTDVIPVTQTTSDGSCEDVSTPSVQQVVCFVQNIPAGGSQTAQVVARVDSTSAQIQATANVQSVIPVGDLNNADNTASVTTNVLTNQSPIARAGLDQNVLVGDTVQLDGSGSDDPDGPDLCVTCYNWAFVPPLPAGSAAVLSGPSLVDPTFVADVAGDYILELIVNDGTDNSAPDQVTITAAVLTTTLHIETVPIQPYQQLQAKAQLWPGLAKVLAIPRNDLGNSGCFLGTVDAAFLLSTKNWSTYGFNTLAKGIILASIGSLDTGNILGNALLKAGSYVGVSVTFNTQTLPEATMQAITEQTIGYILGQATNDFISGVTAGPITNKAMKTFLQDEGVLADKDKGSNKRSRLVRSDLAPVTAVEVFMFYNPNTHFVVAYIGSDSRIYNGLPCGSDLLIVRYEVDQNGLPLNVNQADFLTIPTH